ncbi:hypothetical protein ACFL6U_30900, partial [Planctomycetota bacterium]
MSRELNIRCGGLIYWVSFVLVLGLISGVAWSEVLVELETLSKTIAVDVLVLAYQYVQRVRSVSVVDIVKIHTEIDIVFVGIDSRRPAKV